MSHVTQIILWHSEKATEQLDVVNINREINLPSDLTRVIPSITAPGAGSVRITQDRWFLGSGSFVEPSFDPGSSRITQHRPDRVGRIVRGIGPRRTQYNPLEVNHWSSHVIKPPTKKCTYFASPFLSFPTCFHSIMLWRLHSYELPNTNYRSLLTPAGDTDTTCSFWDLTRRTSESIAAKSSLNLSHSSRVKAAPF